MRGFTLVEMLVVLVIIGIVTTIALVGQSTFNRSLLLTDTAYTLALSIREMQSLGLSSRKYNSVQNPGYGAHFSTGSLRSYTLFADIGRQQGVPGNCPVGTDPTLPDSKPGNCLYDTTGSPVDGVVQTFTFSRGYSIEKFCGTDAGGTERCSPGYLTDLDIAFLRSDSDTVMNGKRTTGDWIQLTSASVYVQSPEGIDKRAICVSKVGQVSVTIGDCL